MARTLYRPRLSTRLPRDRARGFTLIELVVALSAGLLVAASALALSRNASRFFQSEARIAAAQFSATLGMNRLVADLQRAGFLGTRDNSTDPHFCKPTSALPSSINNLTGVRIKRGGSVQSHSADLVRSTDPENGFNPDSIEITGSFDTAERFTTSYTDSLSVRLQPPASDGAMARIAKSAAEAGQTLEQALTPIIRAGRILRVEDPETRSRMYGIITGFTVSGSSPNEVVTISLSNTTPLPIQSAQVTTCGIRGQGIGNEVSVISRIRYDLRSLKGDPRYGAMVASTPATDSLTGENNRTELVRAEIDANTYSEFPDTIELIAEFAVDLKFAVTKPQKLNDTNPKIITYPFDDPQVEMEEYLTRAVDIRLSTRTRVPDRDTPLISGGRPYYFAAVPSTSKVKPRFARMRTLHTHVNLPNMKDEFSP